MLAMLMLTALVPMAPVPAGNVDLRWKFKAGDQFYMTTEQEMKQNIELPNVPKQEIAMSQKIVVQIKVLSSDAKGAVLSQKFLAMKMTATPTTPDVDKIGDLLKGVEIKLNLNEKNEVTKIEGLDNMLDKATSENPALKPIFKTMFTEDTFKQMTGQYFRGPGKPVAPGDTWKLEQKMAMGPLGSIIMTLDNKYVGPKGDLEQTTFKGDMTWKAAEAGEAQIKITKADFKAEKLEGELMFDAKLGRLRSSNMILKSSGSLTVSAAGMEITLGLNQDVQTKMSISDKEPKLDK